MDRGSLYMDSRLSEDRRISCGPQPVTVLFLFISGGGALTVGGREFAAIENDVYIINADTPYAFTGEKGVLYALFRMNLAGTDEFRAFGNVLFRTALGEKEEGEILVRLRVLLMQVIRLSAVKDPYAPVLSNGYAWQIAYLLFKYFGEKLDEDDKKNLDELRRVKIRNYLYAHYKESISLHDLAEHMYLSDAYLSKYIKKNFGQNFLSYLNGIRLTYATAELTEYPERSILQIALSNGFANITSFNKCFQAAFSMTPTQYRKREMDACRGKGASKEEEAILEKGRLLVEEKLSRLEEKPIYRQMQEFMADTAHPEPFHRHWNIVLNGGRVADLLRSDLQEHVAYLAQKLQYRYLRLWDVFSDDMLLNIEGNTGKEKYNFVKIDRVTDFLLKIGVKPFFEMAFKPIRVIKNLNEMLMREERPCVFPSLRQYDSFMDQLLRHFTQRYGVDEVNSWIFELWWSKEAPGRTCKDYLRIFGHTIKGVKKYAPMALVGGAGFELLKSMQELSYFLEKWGQSDVRPDFVSVYAYPYNVNGAEGLVDGRRIQDENYVRDWIGQVRLAAARTGFADTKLFVTEWNASVSSRNILHDACFMGAYIIKNALATIGNVDVLAYWRDSDLHSEYYDEDSLLYGGEGLLTRDGIRKPAYYALNFLNHLRGDLIGRGDLYAITQVNQDDYRVVCCNYRHPGIRYFQEGENLQDISGLDAIFTDSQDVECKICIRGVLPGTYLIKIRRINREMGSVQDEWSRISMSPSAVGDDIVYLKNICIPRIFVQSVECAGKLEFNTTLKANEIQYIHIKRKEADL